ncbi:Transmembrane protein 87A [Acropora cervicornis]|uniref:Transmembrane protein 87A n=1 Tax=Acropora cervicornis TaxID=6130 RepID=A0AAD9Q4N4_ACRCE|nr:Transmembrane protein 87A [Acropora cervicornis]
MKGKHGYLSASDWPLYPFYGFMSLLYVSYGVVWLIVSACQWRDLLRIQFWIGGVIALGMLEKALFFSQYNELNISGTPNQSLTIFAELVPRLGSTLHRVLGVGALYFVLAAMEGCFRSLHRKADPGKQQLIASIPLAILDASICWWIFMSLVQTTRTLRIRRNVVKLSLYRHFTNTLIFAVLASVAYMIWSIKTHRFAKDDCITDWSELWLDDAFWHFLFSLVLLVIMVLWRPTANNQRYAFTPIVDFGEDAEEDDNMTLSDAFDGMKMRNVKNVPEVQINGDSKRKSKPEDDLKWVEENIPSSAADVVLPSVLDSDEELMTTKFEMSKME